MKLNTNWKISHFDTTNSTLPTGINYDTSTWYACEVPGDVHSTLLKHGIIEDPFYSSNDVKCQWVHKKTWWYRNEFEYIDMPEEGERIELTFEGLDTYASIYLNDELIGSHDNMFIPITLDITGKILKGKNTLAVKFHTIDEMTAHKPLRDMWYFFSAKTQWTRKCAMNFGWDWGPSLPTVGIWKDVYIEKKKYAKLESVFIRNKEVDVKNSTAKIDITAEIENFSGKDCLSLQITFADMSVSIPVEGNTVDASLDISNAKLWWPFDIGEPYLYDVKVSLKCGEEVIDSYTTKYGIRDLKVKFFDELHNSRFIFEVNGVDIFARGANWIPAHNFIGSIKDDVYKNLLKMAREGNMNMLRVWGGGIYEKDVFYNECDRLGILVWQDFMFACSEYPDFDDDFMKNVEKEIISVVKRLRNRTCIALWVGNNENHSIHRDRNTGRPMYGAKIYDVLTPSILKQLDTTRLYWPSSPYGGDDPNGMEVGDRHNWDVWHGNTSSYKNYSKCTTPFSSEFGIHAAPVKHTMERNVPKGKLKLGSFELDYRNKDFGPQKMTRLLNEHTGLPKDVDEYVDFTMLVQAEGLKYGVEHYRRRFPQTAGALIWQINDCWPGQSWSMIDYYLYPKASYYYAKKFFAPVIVSFKEEGDREFSIWVTNNSIHEYNDTITFGLYTFLGEEYYTEDMAVNVPANTSTMVKKVRIAAPNAVSPVFHVRWHYACVKPQNEAVPANKYFFMEFKDCVFPECTLSTEFKPIDNGFEVSISTDYFARFVKIEYEVDGAHLSDNYFNINPRETKKVIITHDSIKLEPEMFRIKAINS